MGAGVLPRKFLFLVNPVCHDETLLPLSSQHQNHNDRGVKRKKMLFFFQMFVMQSAPHVHCLVCMCMRVHEGVCVRMCVWMCMCALEHV